MVCPRFRSWPAKKATRLFGDVVEFGEAAACANDVEQVAVIARGRIGPFAGDLAVSGCVDPALFGGVG